MMISRSALGLAIIAIVGVAVIAIWPELAARQTHMPASSEPGTPLHPQVLREDDSGYVIAELYQDVRLDIAGDVYDPDGVLPDSSWTYDSAEQTCSLDLALAVQQGIHQAEPTSTLPPTHTPLPTDPARNPERYQVVERTVQTDNGAGVALAVLPTPRGLWPTSTPRPTYTPYPTPTPPLPIAAVEWTGWEGRPIAVDADGVAILDAHPNVRVSASVSVWTGAAATGQTQLLRMPLPAPDWDQGQVRIDLQEASGRVLLASDDVAAHYRTARIFLEATPLSSCDGLDLRWERSAAVVVRALTTQPWRDWGRLEGTPTPTAPPRTEPALFVAVGADAIFDAAELAAGVSSSTLQATPTTPTVASYIALAVRDDLDPPAGLSDIRETGSPFNIRPAFAPAIGAARPSVTIGGVDYHVYVTLQAWNPGQIGHVLVAK